MVKNPPANGRDTGLISGSGRFPEVGNGYPFQYSHLERSHGQSSLAGYSPWGSKESSTTGYSFCMKVKELVAQPCPSLCNPMDWGLPARFLCPGDFPGKNARLRRWNSPGKNTGVGSHSFLLGIFPIQRSNPGLLHCRRSLYRLSHQGSPSAYSSEGNA